MGPEMPASLHAVEEFISQLLSQMVPASYTEKQFNYLLWNRILSMNDSRLTKKVLVSDMRSEGNFSVNMKHICKECNILNSYDIMSIIDISRVSKCLNLN